MWQHNEICLKKHTPYPHQEEAIKAILKTLKTNNRAQVVMACGSGKSHVCLWVAERLRVKRIAVFVSSLSLVNQLLNEWLAHTVWTNISVMAVCSDDTVTEGIDTFITNPKDCPFPVTTSPVEVHRFLKKKYKGVQLVFCTYHSSAILSTAMNNCPQFDLCIFDEAHKTAGNIDKNFSVALDDKNLPSRKKLFITATPIHYDIHTQSKRPKQLVYSMNDEKVYGPRAYTLTYREAVNLGVVCNYKVLVPIIIRDNIKKRKSGNHEFNKQMIALQKVVKSHNISKIISFHQSIFEAREFAKHLKITLGLSDFFCTHVNSIMPVSERTNKIEQFKNSKKALVSNSRCLTEGTNIPAVDMVMFLNKKRSKVDIVQAIGRATRKHLNKSVGYIPSIICRSQ